MNRWALSLLLCLLLAARSFGQQPDPTLAVVRIPSHGASATIIYSSAGRTLLLGCGHAYQGEAHNKKMSLDIPGAGGGSKPAGIRLLNVDYASDLSLVELADGPLPSCPVAGSGHQPGHLLSAGFDDMKWPATVKSASIVSVTGKTTYTREKPWHGRSGGGLIDANARRLVGVVQGYEVTGQQRGMYVSHATILRFLARNGWTVEGVGAQNQPLNQQQPRQQMPQQFQFQRPGPACPT